MTPEHTNTSGNTNAAGKMKAAELAERLGSEDIVVVDVRSPDKYEAGHVKGAINIPLSKIKEDAPDLPKEKLIVTYCGGGTSGPAARDVLAARGYRAVVMEGMRAWEKANLPIVTGPDPE